jgi:glycosyltransferase involved in cell wall biosynthesis
MPAVLAEHPNATLLIAGFGPEQSALIRLAQKLAVEEHVHFLGPFRHEELPDIYRSARIAVFPFMETTSGDQEGLGLVVVEAAGCGLPVIAGDVPGVRDIVTDGETGLLVPPADHRALASAILSLLEDGETCRQLADTGRAHALRRFDWSVVREGYVELINTDRARRGAYVPY